LLSHRELSFEYEGGAVERYVVFNDAETMKLRMIDPRMNTPRKVDAGAVWNRIPEKESTAKTI
jgi:DNA primase catalytic subunit